MKKLALSLIGALSFLLTGGSAFAQAVHVRVNIPFEFTVSNQALPAGEYQVISADMPNNPTVLQIRQLDGPLATYVTASDLESSNASAETKLVFHQYGDTYFLSEFRTEGSHAAWQFPKTRTEAREAKNESAQQVTLSAKLGK
jgi:hypothetical protein